VNGRFYGATPLGRAKSASRFACVQARELYPPLACANHPLTRARPRTHTRWRTVALKETAVPTFRQRRSYETDYRTRNEYLIRESLFSRYVRQSLLCPRCKALWRYLETLDWHFVGVSHPLAPSDTRTLGTDSLSYALAD